MSSEELKIKIKIPDQEPGDANLFRLFDFLLTDKSQPILEKKSEAIKIIEPLV